MKPFGYTNNGNPAENLVALKEHYGTCDKYVLTQEPYVEDRTISNPYADPTFRFTALAILPDNGPDEDGYYPLYDLTWLPTREWIDDCDNGGNCDWSDACDWTVPHDAEQVYGGYDLEEMRCV